MCRFLDFGSDFVEMFVGVGASRVRDLSSRQKNAPCIILLTKSTRLASSRRRTCGGHDEREQTLNALLVEWTASNPTKA